MIIWKILLSNILPSHQKVAFYPHPLHQLSINLNFILFIDLWWELQKYYNHIPYGS